MIRRYLARREARRAAQADMRQREQQWAEQLAAAVELAIEEARSEAAPGAPLRVDVDDVLDVLARPVFDGVEYGPHTVAGELGGRLRALGEPYVTDAGEPEYNTLWVPAALRAGRPQAAAAQGPGEVEVRLTGPIDAVQRLAEALVEAAEPSTATPVSYRPARDGTAVRARFRIVPAEDAE